MTSATSDSTAATTSPVATWSLAVDQAQQAVARLGERREGLERLEGSRQAAAVALVVVALSAGGARLAAAVGWA